MKALFMGNRNHQHSGGSSWPWIKDGSYPSQQGFQTCAGGDGSMVADIHDEAAVARIMEGRTYDVVAQFIAYGAEDVQRDIGSSRERQGSISLSAARPRTRNQRQAVP